jgi:hypothetical protein
MNAIRLGKMRYGLNPLEQFLVVSFCTTDLHVFHPIPPLTRIIHESLAATTKLGTRLRD